MRRATHLTPPLTVASAIPLTRVTVTATDFKLTPASLTLRVGQPVELTFINRGTTPHNWAVAGLTASHLRLMSRPNGLPAVFLHEMSAQVARGHVLIVAGPNQRAAIRFTPTTAGRYHTLCTLPGHAELGMVGTLVVTNGRRSTSPTARTAPAGPGGMKAMPGMGAVAPSSAMLAQVPRLPQPVVAPPVSRRKPALVRVTLTAREVTGALADGVPYRYWTFNGTVPGPMIRVRQGDTVEVTLKNAPDSTMSHSIDLHAVTGPNAGGDATQVAPGQSATFRFKALNSGVYIYHCMTMPVAQHIANGMYGMIVVEPPAGFPPVDREFYVMEGEYYVQGSRAGHAVRAFSLAKMRDERPDCIVFNGAVGTLQGAHALQARVGEKVRVFFGMGGPNLTASLHAIGVVYDRVHPEGATEELHNVGVTMVPAGGTTMVEFTLHAPGTYTLLDHSFERVLKGAIGTLQVTGRRDPSVFQVVRTAH